MAETEETPEVDNSERDANVVIVDGVRYRKEEAPKAAANKARTTSSGSGSSQTGGKAATK